MAPPNVASVRFTDDDRFLLKFLPGDDPLSQRLRREVHTLNSDANLELVNFVTVIGPTGAGKNHFARVLAGHRQWRRFRESPEAVDVGKPYPDGVAPLDAYTQKLGEQMITALPETLAESLLFGHVEGAFSGAQADYAGLFRDEGYEDILLDEIGDASEPIQAKLLGVLEGRAFIPVGGTSSDRTKCDKRIVMATNRDLQELVAAGRFRKDLFYRIRRHTVRLPSLSENPAAIPKIADSIIDRICPDALRTAGKPPALTEADCKWLKQQPWHGNVRELEEVIELWLYGGASESVETVASERHFAAEQGLANASNWTAEVREYIDDILEGHKNAPETIKDFLDNVTSASNTAVKSALHLWYQETKPAPQVLRRLFPGMRPRSIHTQMSRLGRK